MSHWNTSKVGTFGKGHIPWNKGLCGKENNSYQNLSGFELGGFKGRTHTKEAKEKNRLAHIGIKQTVESNLKRSISSKGISKPKSSLINYRHPKSIEHKLAIGRAHKGKVHTNEWTRNWILANQLKPTRPEKELLSIVEPLGYVYTGDGKVTINGLCPDFVNEDRKKIIEMFGVYWHNDDEVSKRTERFAKFNYDTLVIWDNELNQRRNIYEKCKGFTSN